MFTFLIIFFFVGNSKVNVCPDSRVNTVRMKLMNVYRTHAKMEAIVPICWLPIAALVQMNMMAHNVKYFGKWPAKTNPVAAAPLALTASVSILFQLKKFLIETFLTDVFSFLDSTTGNNFTCTCRPGYQVRNRILLFRFCPEIRKNNLVFSFNRALSAMSHSVKLSNARMADSVWQRGHLPYAHAVWDTRVSSVKQTLMNVNHLHAKTVVNALT